MHQVHRTFSASRFSSVIPCPSTTRSCPRRPLICNARAAFGTTNNNHVLASDRLVKFSAGMASAAVLLSSPSVGNAAEPFETQTGLQESMTQQQSAPLSQQSGELRREVMQQREVLESEARQTQTNQLCATPFGIDIVGVTVFIALIGAAVGGYTARKRKEEAERLNEQLRKINASLRQQARAGTMIPPGLQYSPLSSSSSSSSSSNKTATITLPQPAITIQSAPTAAAAAAAAASSAPAAAGPVAVRTLLSMDENELTAEQMECKETLRAGKRLLKEKKAAEAQPNFEQALVLSRMIGDRIQERRAVRGLAAAARLQQQYTTAIGHLERVLEISRELKEYTGDADAYGTIADCYTELGNFEKAADFYDKYITRMED